MKDQLSNSKHMNCESFPGINITDMNVRYIVCLQMVHSIIHIVCLKTTYSNC